MCGAGSLLCQSWRAYLALLLWSGKFALPELESVPCFASVECVPCSASVECEAIYVWSGKFALLVWSAYLALLVWSAKLALPVPESEAIYVMIGRSL